MWARSGGVVACMVLLAGCPRLALVGQQAIELTGAHVDPDRSLYRGTGTAEGEVFGFAGDVLVVEGSGWDPQEAQVSVAGVTFTRESGSTPTALRVTVPMDAPSGVISVDNLDRHATPRRNFTFRFLGPGHLRTPRFLNQLQPSIIVTQLRAATAGANPPGVVAASFGFGNQPSQLGEERFVAHIDTTSGKSAITPIEASVRAVLPFGSVPFQVNADTPGGLSRSSVATVADDAIYLHRDQVGALPIPPPEGMRWTHTLLPWGPDPFAGTSPYFYAVATDVRLDPSDGGFLEAPPQRSQVLALLQDDTVDAPPVQQVFASGVPARALGILPGGIDRTHSGDDAVLVDIGCSQRCTEDFGCEGPAQLTVRRTRLVPWGDIASHGLSTVAPPGPDNTNTCISGSPCDELLRTENDPELAPALDCAYRADCQPQFRCLFAPEGDPYCETTLQCFSTDECHQLLTCRDGLCGQALDCLQDSACRAHYDGFLACSAGGRQDIEFCSFANFCMETPGCEALVQCQQEPACNAMRECQLNPACRRAVESARPIETAARCSLDPDCNAAAGCGATGMDCTRALQCADLVCGRGEPLRIVPLTEERALLVPSEGQPPGPACTFDLRRNRLQAFPLNPESITAVPNREGSAARAVWLPRRDLSEQQVWSGSLEGGGVEDVAIESTRARYALLESDPQLRRVYAVPRSGPDVDILDERGQLKGSVNVLGVPLNVVPVDALGTSADSLLLFLYPGITVLTDATGAKRFTQVLTVEASPDVGSEATALHFQEEPGVGLRALWLTANKLGVPSRVLTVTVPRESGEQSETRVFADLSVQGEGAFFYYDGGTVIPVAVTPEKVFMLVTAPAGTMTDALCPPQACAQADTGSCYVDADTPQCSFLATLDVGPDGKALVDGRDADGGADGHSRLKMVPGTCSPPGARPAVHDVVRQRLYWQAPRACTDDHPETPPETRMLDLSGDGKTPCAASARLPEGRPITALPTGGVVGSFAIERNGSTQYELATVTDACAVQSSAMVLGAGSGLAVSPDGKRIYAGGDNAILDIAWEEQGARATLSALIPVQGSPTRIHTDLKGERLVFLDDAAKTVGLVK